MKRYKSRINDLIDRKVRDNIYLIAKDKFNARGSVIGKNVIQVNTKNETKTISKMMFLDNNKFTTYSKLYKEVDSFDFFSEEIEKEFAL